MLNVVMGKLIIRRQIEKIAQMNNIMYKKDFDYCGKCHNFDTINTCINCKKESCGICWKRMISQNKGCCARPKRVKKELKDIDPDKIKIKTVINDKFDRLIAVIIIITILENKRQKLHEGLNHLDMFSCNYCDIYKCYNDVYYCTKCHKYVCKECSDKRYERNYGYCCDDPSIGPCIYKMCVRCKKINVNRIKGISQCAKCYFEY